MSLQQHFDNLQKLSIGEHSLREVVSLVSKPIRCPLCYRKFGPGADYDFINEYGTCLECDKERDND